MRHFTTEQRHDLRQLRHLRLCALAFASLPGCGEQSPTEPEAFAPQVAQPDELAADFTADQSAATRSPRSFFVNPITGKDTNAGTKLLPFKTLARALSSAIAKDTVRLTSGVYSATTNGERFTTTLGQLCGCRPDDDSGRPAATSPAAVAARVRPASTSRAR